MHYVMSDIHNPNPVDLYFKILSLSKRCTIIRGNHDHWLATYILDYYALPERKRRKLAPYPYNSFSLLQERLTPIDMQNLANDILSWPLQKIVEVAGKKYLLSHAMTTMPTNLESENHYLLGSLIIQPTCRLV